MKNRKYLILVLTVVLVLVVDMITKSIFDLKVIPIISGFISIDGNAHNTGAAFSIFSNSTIFLKIFTLFLLIGLVLFYILNKNKSIFMEIGLSLMIAGAIGNLIDRIMLGYVRDFIKTEFINFPIFNIADCALTIGVIILSIGILLYDFDKDKKINI